MIKTNNIKSFLAVVAFGFIATSCSEDNITPTSLDAKNQETSKIDSKDIALSLKVDNAIEAVNNLSLDFPVTGFGKNLKSNATPAFGCMSYKSSLENGDYVFTVKFEDSCDVFGNTYKGAISYTSKWDMETKSYKMSKTYDKFSVNEMIVDGTIASSKEWKSENGNPKCVDSIDLTITLEEDQTVTRKGTMSREWEGSETPKWDDDAFVTTGDWTTTFADGTAHSYIITKPLRFLPLCGYHVSGVVEITDAQTQGVLDYGDGECDNKATLTNADGDVIEIEL